MPVNDVSCTCAEESGQFSLKLETKARGVSFRDGKQHINKNRKHTIHSNTDFNMLKCIWFWFCFILKIIFYSQNPFPRWYSHPAGCWRPASLRPHTPTPPLALHLTGSRHQRMPESRKETAGIKSEATHTEEEGKGARFGFHTRDLLGSPDPFPLRSRGTAPCSLAPLNKSSTTSLELFFFGGPTICCPLRSDPPAKNLPRWETWEVT